MTGGPIGFSSDLEALPEKYKSFWRSAIAEFKEDREIYAKGGARLLADADGVVAIEYADEDLDKCLIQVFSNRCFATDLLLYPVVDEQAEYIFDGKCLSGKDISTNGIVFSGITNNDCKILKLTKKDNCNEN
jgi:hypothetical protein